MYGRNFPVSAHTRMKKILFSVIVAATGALASTAACADDAFDLQTSLCASIANGGYGSAQAFTDATSGHALTFAGHPAAPLKLAHGAYGVRTKATLSEVQSAVNSTKQPISVRPVKGHLGEVDLICQPEHQHLTKEQQDAD